MAIQINGNGTITGISVGGLPDGIVDTDMIANNAVTNAKATGIAGGKILQVVSNSTAGNVNVASGASNPTAAGLITTITPTAANSNFLVTSTGTAPKTDSDAGNAGILIFLYASVAGGSYANVRGTRSGEEIGVLGVHTESNSYIDHNGANTVYVSGLSYSVGNTVAFQYYYKRGAGVSGTVYYHNGDASGSLADMQLTVMEVAA